MAIAKLLISACLLSAIYFHTAESMAQRQISVVPQPVSLEQGAGEFTLRPDTVIQVSKDTTILGQQLAAIVQPATGLYLRVISTEASRPPSENRINLTLDSSLMSLGDEGYQLIVTPETISISAPKPAGIFYGIQTLRQLLPTEIYREATVAGQKFTAPCVTIEDYRRFKWRGLHLDVCRHFMPKEFVKKYIDLLALHKMNRFHWHLTEDQGWRIEIKKYPKLTTVGAWRKETLAGHYRDRPAKFDGKPHGGFYTQEDIREIVEYARQRFVTIVPEIEMPGHLQTAIAA